MSQHEDGSDDGSDASDGEGFVTVVSKKSKKKSKKGKVYHCKGGLGKTCGLAFKKKEPAIECDGCHEWFHPNCQDLSIEAYNAIGLHKLFWVCESCRKAFNDTITLSKVVARVERAEKNIIDSITGDSCKRTAEKQLEEKIDSMETKVVEKLSEQKDAILRSSDTIRKAMIESKEDREMNLILHNFPESDSTEPEVRKESDLAQFHEMSRALSGEDTQLEVEKIFRLGKKEATAKPRLLLVRLKSATQVENLYKKRFKLKEVGFANRYITHDLAPEERTRQRELREELKAKGRDTHKIFQNKVVPRDQK